MIENPWTRPAGSSTSMLKQIATRPALYTAWRKVRANRGAAGIDAISLKEFERNLEANLAELSRNLLSQTYEPLPVRQVNIPKRNGKERELMIPTVRDRVAQRAVLDAIEPLFEPGFLDCSFAFRPGRSVAMAIQQVVIARAKGFLWTVDADIKDFFPSIAHQLLLDALSESIQDEDLLALIRKWLDAGLLEAEESATGWMKDLRATVAGAQLAVSDGINHLLSEYVSDRLGVSAEAALDDETTAFDDEDISASQETSRRQARRAAMRKLVRGNLLAISGLQHSRRRRDVEEFLIHLERLAHQNMRQGVLRAPEHLHGGGEINAHGLAPAGCRRMDERIRIFGQFAHDVADLVAGKLVFFDRANVFEHGAVGFPEQGDGCFVELDAVAVNAIIAAELGKLAGLRVEQYLFESVATGNGSDHTNLINRLLAFLGESVQRFQDDLRR